MAVEVKPGEELSLGEAQTLFGFDSQALRSSGRRFLFVPEMLEEPSTRETQVVLNWFEELKAKVPTGR